MTDMNRMNDVSQAPIGVFDSGVGGLTVAREIMRQMPNEKIIYFGDTARVPYGTKSKDTITRFSRQIARFLQTHQVKTIVVACNTASAYAMEELEAELDIPVIGVVKPGARMATDITQNGKIGVIATEGCVLLKRNYYEFLNKYSKQFIAISSAVKSSWVKKGIDDRKINVIYNEIY